jgi:hypothetical protein
MLLAGIAGGTFIRTTGNHQSWLPILRTGRLRRFGKPILLRRKRRLPVAGIFRRNRRNCLLWLPVEHLRNFFEGIERRFREIDRRNAGRGFGNRFTGTAGGRPRLSFSALIQLATERLFLSETILQAIACGEERVFQLEVFLDQEIPVHIVPVRSASGVKHRK